MKDTWIKSNTFHYKAFCDLNRLVAHQTTKRSLKISLCLPTLNEEKTIAKEIVIFKSELMSRHPLLDEIVVVDSGSTDGTRDIARTYGADVYRAADILPHLPPYTGKGENLWRALYVTQRGYHRLSGCRHQKHSPPISHTDSSGPLLEHDHIKYTKAFYDRPIAIHATKPSGRPAAEG